MARFRRHVAVSQNVSLPDYATLHRYSVEQAPAFWRAWLERAPILWSGSAEPAIEGKGVEFATFFPNVRLNYAESLLHGAAASFAIAAYDEDGLQARVTRGDLERSVIAMARGLRAAGVGPGDHVCGMVRNAAESIVACLATLATGAVWSSVAMDLGTDAVLARFRQLAPKVLVAHGSTKLQGILRPADTKLRALVDGLPSLKGLLPLDASAELPGLPVPLLSAVGPEDPPTPWSWERFPFNHPLLVLFSSGTTGPPKCIVHGAGGTLLEHTKELQLHSDLGPEDVLYFHTSAGWMMWNWQMSALAAGVEIVLYEGSVSHPAADSLLALLDQAGVTAFGTSPAYLQFLKDSAIVPSDRFALGRLRAMFSTGSICPSVAFEWCRDNFPSLPLQSISGGTDIIGCFVLGNPELPVYAGESQCLSLGYDVRAMQGGMAVSPGRGDLVCCAPFPSRPLGFLDDASGARFHDAYFAANEGAWTHGDLIDISERGTARVLGRNDGTLNVRGVRIGPAEVTQIVMEVDGVRQAMAVEQRSAREHGGSRMVLLVVLAPGVVLDRPLQLRLKKELATRASANHVPAVIVDVAELPVTFSGKLSERAARDAINDDVVANAAALRNPACLDALRTRIQNL